MNLAIKEEIEGKTVLVYMDESFVRQAHGSAHPYFCKNEDGVMHDGFGTTTGKGLRVMHSACNHEVRALGSSCSGSERSD